MSETIDRTCTSCDGTSRRRFLAGALASLGALVFAGPAFGRGKTSAIDDLRNLRREIRRSTVGDYLKTHLVSKVSKILDALNHKDLKYACNRLESMKQNLADKVGTHNLSQAEADDWTAQINTIEQKLGCQGGKR